MHVCCRRFACVVSLMAITVGCAAGCGTAAAQQLPVPDVRQSSEWTCGASALLAVLAYYGVDEREDRLSRDLGATPDKGASPSAIVRVATARGLSAELREGLTIEDLASAVGAGEPVLIAVQAWGKPGSYRDTWDDGHYVVVIGVTRDRVIVEDPSMLGSRGFLTRQELAERWHDTDGSRRYIHMGIVFGGKPPAPPGPLQHVD